MFIFDKQNDSLLVEKLKRFFIEIRFIEKISLLYFTRLIFTVFEF